MKAYGLPRELNLEFPDVGDIQYYGLKTCTGRVRGSKHECRSYTRKTANRNSVRRRWKKRYRRLIKTQIKEENNE